MASGGRNQFPAAYASRLRTRLLGPVLVPFWLATALNPQLAFADDYNADDNGTAGNSSNQAEGHKSGFTQQPPFGGRSAPGVLLEEDDRVVLPYFRSARVEDGLQGWFDWKRDINENYDLKLGGYYMTTYQKASDSQTDEDDAWGGKVRLTSVWTPIQKSDGNFGRLAATFDYRHKYSDIAATELAQQIGYLGQTQVVLSDGGFSIIHLNWAQSFNQGNGGVIAGRIDPNDYLDVLGYSSPWTGFSASTIQLNASLSFQESAWGLLGGNWFNDNWYAIGIVSDANGFAEDDLEFFDGGSEFFKQIEIGWAPSKAERLNRKFNISLWHKDEREEAGRDSGEGVLFSAGWTFDRWTTFFRAGYSEGEAPAFNKNLVAGFLYGFEGVSDQLGVGFNWGDPSVDERPEQTTSEVFYRLHVSQNFAVTPHLIYIDDPALNEQDGSVWVAGIRFRITY